MSRNAGAARQRAVARALISFSRSKDFDTTGYEDDPDDVWSDPERHPFGYLVGVIFDQNIQAERAWKAPGLLRKRLGHLNPRRIRTMTRAELRSVIAKFPALHRFPARVADWLIEASDHVVRVYGGRTERIWGGGPSVAEMEKRFDSIKGIGQKKRSMATNILVREYGVVISGSRQAIDVSNDVHVQRVFLRAGLVGKATERTIIDAARVLQPRYPGALDLPAWRVGRTWCVATSPKCGECWLTSACPKLTTLS